MGPLCGQYMIGSIEMGSSIEKRTHTRFSILEYVLVDNLSTGGNIRSLMVDVSLRGAQIRCREVLEVGNKVVLHIPREATSAMELNAEVRYCYEMEDDNIQCVGVKFTPLTKIEQLQIAHYLYDMVIKNKSFEDELE